MNMFPILFAVFFPIILLLFEQAIVYPLNMAHKTEEKPVRHLKPNENFSAYSLRKVASVSSFSSLLLRVFIYIVYEYWNARHFP